MSAPHEVDALLDYYLTLAPGQRAREFATTADAAKWCGVSQRTIKNWVDRGAVRAVRVGWKYFVSLPSLREHLSRHE